MLVAARRGNQDSVQQHIGALPPYNHIIRDPAGQGHLPFGICRVVPASADIAVPVPSATSPRRSRIYNAKRRYRLFVGKLLKQNYREILHDAEPGFITFVQIFGDLVTFNPHMTAVDGGNAGNAGRLYGCSRLITSGTSNPAITGRRNGPYTLRPVRRSVGYAVHRSGPSQRRLNVLATAGGEKCGLRRAGLKFMSATRKSPDRH